MIGLTTLAAISLLVGSYYATVGQLASFDFHWSSTRVIIYQQNPYTLAEPSNATISKILGTRTENIKTGAINLPSSLTLLLPYAALKWDYAKIAWLISNFLFTGICLLSTFKLAPGLSSTQKWLITLLVVASTPFRVNIGNGQHALFVIAFALLAIILASRHPISSGIAMGVALFKYHLIGPLLIVLAIQKTYKPFGIALIMHIFLLIGVSYWINENPVKLVITSLSFAKNLSNAGWIDLAGVTQLPLMLIYGLCTIIGLLLTYKVWITRLKTTTLDGLAMISVLSLLAVYHRIYDFVLLMIPLAWIIQDYQKTKTLTPTQLITGGWILAIWFGEKLIEYALPVAGEPYRHLVAAWGWISLTLLALYIFKRAEVTKK